MNITPSCEEERLFVEWAKNVIRNNDFSKQSTILDWRRALYSRPLESLFAQKLQNIDAHNDENALDLSDEAIGLTDVHLLALYMGTGDGLINVSQE